MNRKGLRGVGILLLTLTLALCCGFAQTSSTSILGTITDATGALIVGANVTARHVARGTTRETVTSSTGDYYFPFLEVGEYEVTVTAAGFKTETRKNITLQLNQKARIDLTLQVGAQSERVEVTSSAPLLHTDQVALGHVVEHRRIVEIPLLGRNIAGLAILQPGIQFGNRMGFDGQNPGGGLSQEIPGAGGTALSSNGQRDINMSATLDGVNAQDARVNSLPFTPSVEAVEEIKVQSASYSAEYGTHNGAQLNISLKSGTNEFHGVAFDFLRNEKFDAEGYFTNYFNAPGTPRRPKDSLKQNQYGGIFSGPVIIPRLYSGKNRTFFMFNYEAKKQRTRNPAGTRTLYAPTAFRQGDLSALLRRRSDSGASLPSIQIIDPLTGVPFAGNIIPPSRITSTAKNLMAYMLVPQYETPDPISGYNFIATSSGELNSDQRYVRIDHELTAKDKIFARYAYQDVWSTSRYNNPYFPFSSRGGKNQNLALQWVRIVSPRVINELRFGYNRSNADGVCLRTNTDFDIKSLGLNFGVVSDNNRPFSSRETGFPGIGIQNFSGLGDCGGDGTLSYQHEWGDNMIISHAAHNFKLGVDVLRVGMARFAANVPRGSMTFNDDIALSGWAAFLLGFPSNTQTPEGMPGAWPLQYRNGFYFQDDWRASRKLTVNLGLRYELNTPVQDQRGALRSLSFRRAVNGIPMMVPNFRESYAFYNMFVRNFQPRVGLAFQATDKWVIRTGYGIYFNIHHYNNYSILALNPPRSGSSIFYNAAQGGVLVQTPGTPLLTYSAPFGVVDNTRPMNAVAIDEENFQPYSNQWSFDIQRQLPLGTVLTVGYVGSKTTHLDNSVQINEPEPALSSLPTTPQQRRPYQFVIDGPGGPTRTLTTIRWQDSKSNAWYHGLQVYATKQFSHGFQYTLAYTWSKAMGEGCGRNDGCGPGGGLMNPNNRAADKTRYGFDVKHNAVMSFIYEIPTAPAFRRGLGNAAFGGWQMNGVWTLRTGFPFAVTQGTTLNNGVGNRPDRVGSGKLDHPTLDHWFDTEAFHVVTCQFDYLADRCHYGNSGNGILEGPGFHNLDFSLFKNFALTEKLKLQFRAELFNAFNSPNFWVPNASLTASSAFLPKRDASGKLGPYPVQSGRVGGPGAITSTVAAMRVVQLAVKLSF